MKKKGGSCQDAAPLSEPKAFSPALLKKRVTTLARPKQCFAPNLVKKKQTTISNPKIGLKALCSYC